MAMVFIIGVALLIAINQLILISCSPPLLFLYIPDTSTNHIKKRCHPYHSPCVYPNYSSERKLPITTTIPFEPSSSALLLKNFGGRPDQMSNAVSPFINSPFVNTIWGSNTAGQLKKRYPTKLTMPKVNANAEDMHYDYADLDESNSYIVKETNYDDDDSNPHQNQGWTTDVDSNIRKRLIPSVESQQFLNELISSEESMFYQALPAIRQTQQSTIKAMLYPSTNQFYKDRKHKKPSFLFPQPSGRHTY